MIKYAILPVQMQKIYTKNEIERNIIIYVILSSW